MTSYFDLIEIGDREEVSLLFGLRKRIYELTNKWQISLHECPRCGSSKTFHKERVDDMEGKYKRYANCFADAEAKKHDMIYHKKDLCLDCGELWTFEMMCYRSIKTIWRWQTI